MRQPRLTLADTKSVADAERAVIRIVRRQAIRLATVFSQVWREPGGNVTGSSLQLNDTAGKRLELLA